MKTRTAHTLRPASTLTLAAALVAALVGAAGARAADKLDLVPLKATRFVSVGLSGSDALSIATDRCVDQISARAPTAQVACKLAVRRARAAALDPLAMSFAARGGRQDYAYALGNLAVAQHLAGNSQAAKASVELALLYAPDEPTLVSNLAALEARRLAASTTAGNVK
jgi:hypothetical protein